MSTDVSFFNTFSDLICITSSISRSIDSKSVPRISILPFTICIIDTSLIFISIRFEVFEVIATFLVEIDVYNESFPRTLRSFLFTFSGTWSHEVIWFFTSIRHFQYVINDIVSISFFFIKKYDLRHRFLQIADQLNHKIDHVNMIFSLLFYQREFQGYRREFVLFMNTSNQRRRRNTIDDFIHSVFSGYLFLEMTLAVLEIFEISTMFFDDNAPTILFKKTSIKSFIGTSALKDLTDGTESDHDPDVTLASYFFWREYLHHKLPDPWRRTVFRSSSPRLCSILITVVQEL